MINETEIEQVVNMVYEYFKAKLMQEQEIRNSVKVKIATVDSFTDDKVVVKFPFESDTVVASNQSADTLSVGDTVAVGYWNNLNNAFVIMKK